MSSAASDPDAVLSRLEAAVDHLAARVQAAREAMATVAPAAAPEGPSRSDIAALADRLEATLARLRLAAEDPTSEE